ncbi:histidine kinase [Nonomuraea sp. NN258]|uniref:sensor histidine kinase n=1 Tax=Nonomuraea antri TaxID=2730852 RepID=UPI00156957CD|nr:histidine kinase [Nonomuraea antri]NRQ39775.1 histidine kinase [Nonomuraea antri]
MTGTPGRPARWQLTGAAVLCALTVASLIGWGALLFGAQAREGDLGTLLDDAGPVLVALVLAGCGLVIVAHRPGLAMGWLFLATGLVMIMARVASELLPVVHDHGAALTAVLLVWVLGAALHAFLTAVLPLHFPDGRLRAPRPYVFLVAAWALTVSFLPVVAQAEQAGRPNPLRWWAAGRAAGDLYERFHVAVNLSFAVVIGIGLAVLARHWRHADTTRRRQAVMFIGPYLLWAIALKAAYYLQLSGWLRFALLCCCAALLSAVIVRVFGRDRVWAVNRSARRLLTCFVLTVGLILLPGGAVALVLLLAPGARTWPALALAALTLAVGLTARLAVRWSAGVADRLCYGRRAHPYQLVRHLAGDLGRAPGPQEAARLLCDTVVEQLGLPAARIVVLTRHGPREVAARGRMPDRHGSFDLVHQGAVVGALRVGARAGESGIDAQDRDILRILLAQSAASVAACRLYEDLQASREQIITAREEERRRLRREIHDGLGATLSALRLWVDTASAQIPGDSSAAASLGEVSEGIARLVVDVRRITDGLVPVALADFGLSEGVRRLADSLHGGGPRIEVELDPDPLVALPAAVEVAAYRIVSEALTNAVRHARAANCLVKVALTPAALAVEVRDDGTGFRADSTHPGIGLRSMAERAAELSGRFCMSSNASGTRVQAWLPHSTPGPL